MTYSLHVSFKSNEAPWHTVYTPPERHQQADDDAAKEWARGMAKQLEDYTVTLTKDGKVLDFTAALKDQP